MTKRYLLLVLFILSVVNILSASSNAIIIHHELNPVVFGDKARFEMNLVSQQTDIYEARVFYRSQGEMDFKSAALKDEGFTLYTEIETKNLNPGNIEYYFAMQTVNGDIITYPEFSQVGDFKSEPC